MRLIHSSCLGLRYRHLTETVQATNLWQPTDSFISAIPRAYPGQDETIERKNSYPTEISPSGSGFPQIFSYVPSNFHHRLSSNIDDNSLLIPNPSLT